MPKAPTPVLDDASAALVESAHAAKVLAVTGADGRATLAHAYACSLSADRRRLRVTVERAQAAPLLEALPASPRVALVACHIRTLQSVQLKGVDARVVRATAAERRAAASHGEEFARFGASLGHAEPMMRAHMGCRAEDVVVVAFTVSQAFVQTPGPAAGTPLAPTP